MKNVSFMPVSYVNNYQQPSYQIHKYNTAGDSVSFKAAKPPKTAKNNIMGLLKNVSPDLGNKINEIMSSAEGRTTFTTVLVSLAATVTELLLKSPNNYKGEVPTDINLTDAINAFTPDNAKDENTKGEQKTGNIKGNELPNTNSVNTKRRRYVREMGEEQFKAKLQEMVNRGLTLQQMSVELGGLAQSSVHKYLKKFDIKRNIEVKENAPEENVKQIITEQKNVQEEKNPQQVDRLSKIKDYPNLTEKYTNLISNKNDEHNQQLLEGFEKILDYLLNKDNLPSKIRTQYLKLLETDYINNLEEISVIIKNTKPENKIQEFFNNLQAGNYSSEDLVQWSKVPAFTYNEFKNTFQLEQDKINKIHELKKEGDFNFSVVINKKWNNYTFKLTFNSNISLQDKLKTIARFHEALYDNIYLHKDSGIQIRRAVDIQEELQNYLEHDKAYDSLYSILKYLEPEKLENYNYKYNHYSKSKTSIAKNVSVKNKLATIIADLDIRNNERLSELVKVLNNEKIFKNIISNNHAKLRFISRFVLNKDVKGGELENKCIEAMNCLEKILNNKFNSEIFIFPYIMQDSTAPCLFLPECELGDFIRITFNNCGQIHTIFEDYSQIKKSSRK